jgi:hypothetical protein
MAQVLQKLKRLKGRSLGELRERSAQALKAYAERRGLYGASRVPSDAAFFKKIDAPRISSAGLTAENFLTHFRTRRGPRFFPGFDNRESTLGLIRGLSSSDSDSLIKRADRIVGGRFDLLGLRDLSFGPSPDWHLEPVSGKRSPLLHWSQIDYLDARVAGDKKIVWELNRHQYFATLGRAYWLTGDERYAETFAAHVESWIDENPAKLGINWASSLEVAFRSVSWLWAIHFFKDSSHLTPGLFLRVSKLLYVHARHLENYLSTYFSPNTHLTGEALGLFYLGTLLPEFKEAARWRGRGERILLAELERQVYADGVYFEQASYYQRYTADFYTHLFILAQINGLSMKAGLAEKLTGLMDHLMHITRPEGTTPLFGDDDGGRLLPLDERAADDFRATLSTAAALFKRPDYKFVAGELAEETVWLLGTEGARAFERLEARARAIIQRVYRRRIFCDARRVGARSELYAD